MTGSGRQYWRDARCRVPKFWDMTAHIPPKLFQCLIEVFDQIIRIFKANRQSQ